MVVCFCQKWPDFYISLEDIQKVAFLFPPGHVFSPGSLQRPISPYTATMTVDQAQVDEPQYALVPQSLPEQPIGVFLMRFSLPLHGKFPSCR